MDGNEVHPDGLGRVALILEPAAQRISTNTIGRRSAMPASTSSSMSSTSMLKPLFSARLPASA
jgi:hypothetical protein